MTMSTSSAPARTASRVSASLTGGSRGRRGTRWRPRPRGRRCRLQGVDGDVRRGRCRRRPPRRAGGRVARVGGGAPWRTASGPCRAVSAPSRVVRSIIEMAVSIAQALAVVLIERVARSAARASAPTWSTPGRPCSQGAGWRRSACRCRAGRAPGQWRWRSSPTESSPARSAAAGDRGRPRPAITAGRDPRSRPASTCDRGRSRPATAGHGAPYDESRHPARHGARCGPPDESPRT